ncbi:hypothetical protein PF006_g24179 [Phytophthora fragariae]|uniref:Uncharacterized protein n=1 Tax=Phytophthora fragariae TaxID=53985 RepID=A0A6A3RDV8_9STRA|nr:hypothetical protein PF006_g24179 [Phytophthora fragariae]
MSSFVYEMFALTLLVQFICIEVEATNEFCQFGSPICAYDIHVSIKCSSACGTLVRRLGFDVPKRYTSTTENTYPPIVNHWLT